MTLRAKILLGVFLSLCLTATGVHSVRTNAQTIDNLPEYDEEVAIQAGDIVEILPVTDTPIAHIAWTLTRGRAFLEATQDPIFRTRQVTPGMYMVDGSIALQDGTTLRRKFLLNVSERPLSTASVDAGNDWIFQSVPPSVDWVISLPESTQLVTIIPNRTDTERFGLDLDVERDEETGVPTGNTDTYAYMDVTPLTLWFPTPRSRVLEVALQKLDGTVARERVQIALGDAPIAAGGGIVTQAQADGSVRFILERAPSGEDILIEWDFGDGSKSLISSPLHQYAADGVYRVSVSVRKLSTSEEILTKETVFTVTTAGPVTSSSASSEDSSSSASSGGNSGGFLAGIRSFLSTAWVRILLLLIGGIALLGLAILVVLALLRRTGGGKLEERLANAEDVIMKRSGVTENVNEAPPPMELRRGKVIEAKVSDDVVAEEKPEPKMQEAKETPAPEPVVDLEKAPSWLKKGIEKAKEEPSVEPIVTTPEPPKTPVVEPKPAPIDPPKPAPAAAPVTEAAPAPRTMEPTAAPVVAPAPQPPATSDIPVPSWLKEQAPAPTPVATATVEPPAAPVVAPAAAKIEPRVAPPVQKPAEPQPTPTPNPIAPPLPTETKAAEPASPEELPKEEAADVTPEKVEPSPAEGTTPQGPASVTTKNADQAAREQERKRQKRMRYRENLKKRKQEERAKTPIVPAATSEAKKPESASVTKTASAPSAPVQAVETPKVQVAAPVEQKKIEEPKEMELPEPRDLELSEPKADHLLEKPKATTPAVTTTSEPERIPDDQIAFVIKAEDVPPVPPKDTGDSTTQK